jgi:hypothetical protein
VLGERAHREVFRSRAQRGVLEAWYLVRATLDLPDNPESWTEANRYGVEVASNWLHQVFKARYPDLDPWVELERVRHLREGAGDE